MKISFFKLAAYIFLLALVFKGMVMWDSAFPPRERLVRVQGIIRKVHLGGEGQATYFEVEAEAKTRRYSSYYCRPWPGMETLAAGDFVKLLAERKKMRRWGEREKFWIWELSADGRRIVGYEDMLLFRRQAAKEQNSVADMAILAGAALLILASVRKFKLFCAHR